MVAAAVVAVIALSAGDVITADGGFPGARGQLFFVSDRDGNREIYTLNDGGAGQRRETLTAASELTPAIAPTNGFAYYFASDEGGDFDIYLRIGSRFKAVTLPGDDIAPASSPRGAGLAFEHRVGGQGDIYLTAQGVIRPLTSGPADDGAPAWSAWKDYSPIGQVTNPAPPVCPFENPGLAYHSNTNGTYDIWVMNEDGTDPHPVTSDDADDFNPDWSPDCRLIAFERRSGGNYDIWVVEPASGAQFPLAVGRRQDTDPVWAPDGKRIAWVSDRTGNDEIFAADVVPDGDRVRLSLIRNFTLSPGGDDFAPDWQPRIGGFLLVSGDLVAPLPPPGGRLTCTQVGTDRADTMKGSSGPDVLCGEGGADVLHGLRGNDILIGGGGNDRFFGGRGKDGLRTKDAGPDAVVDGGGGFDEAIVDDPTVDKTRGVERVMRR